MNNCVSGYVKNFLKSFNPLYTNGFFLLLRYNTLGIVHYTYLGCQVIIFKKYCILLSEDLFFLQTV